MKKILSGILAASMVMSFAAVTAFAADYNTGDVTFAASDAAWDGKEDDVWDSDNGVVDTTTNSISIESLRPGSVIIVPIANGLPLWTDLVVGNKTDATSEQFANSDLFKFDYDKDTNGKYVSKIELVTDKKYSNANSGARTDAAIKFTIGEYLGTSELHTDGTITFTAKKDSLAGKTHEDAKGKIFNDGDEITIDYSFWLSNEKIDNDGNPEAGDRVFFNPDKNDTNVITWGDDRASLKFDADNDASKFYARLETGVDRALYAEYGDPADAELWFYTFVNASAIPSTSRATLTLGVPWDEDDDYVPDPESCFIYEKDADGMLVDATDKFTFSEEDEEIAGWSIKTRTLGTYVISDTELDVEAINADEEVTDDEPATVDPTTPTGGKDIPQTGSSDMVNVAVVAAVVSLAAAGAVAFRKAK